MAWILRYICMYQDELDTCDLPHYSFTHVDVRLCLVSREMCHILFSAAGNSWLELDLGYLWPIKRPIHSQRNVLVSVFLYLKVNEYIRQIQLSLFRFENDSRKHRVNIALSNFSDAWGIPQAIHEPNKTQALFPISWIRLWWSLGGCISYWGRGPESPACL